MLSFDTQRSHGVRDAPSHGNTQERVHGEVQDRAFNSEEYQTACGDSALMLHNDQSMIRVKSILRLPPPPTFGVYLVLSFVFLHAEKLT